MTVTLYHNPRCSKSRETLRLLEDRNITPELVLYLETPPTAEQISDVLAKLGIEARALVRTSEDAYKHENLADESLSEADLISAMVKHPKLIQRPIVITEKGARIGRPPESVLEVL